MALTAELLRANAAVATLTDEQISAIVTLSQNDEATVIGQKTGEIYGGLDNDILAASGMAKEGTEKTYDYAKRVIGAIKEKADSVDDLNSKIAGLEREKTRLEKAVQDGAADAEVKKELTKVKADLANVTRDYTELKTKYDNAEAEHAKALFGIQLDGEFAKATAGLKFKAEYPASVTKVLTDQAIAKVKAMNPEFIDDGKGGKVLAFMQDGAVLRNKENGLNPYTAAELVAKELQTMGVLDAGRKQTGAGSTGGQTGAGGAATDVSGARTQEEAHEIIARQLMAQGKVNGSKEFEDAMAQAWKDNHDVIKALPLR